MTTSGTHMLTKRKIQPSKRSILIELSDFFYDFLAIENEVYIDDASGKIVYHQQDKEPVIGFVHIYHHAREIGTYIDEDLGKDCFEIENAIKCNVSALRLKQALDEYESKTPDITKVVKIFSRQGATFPHLGAPSSDPGVDPDTYNGFATDSPDYLACYVAAVTHPLLGEVIHYLKLFTDLNVDETRAVEGIQAKNHDEFISSLKERLLNAIKAELVLDPLFDTFKAIVVNNARDLWQVNQLIDMIKKIGKKYLNTILMPIRTFTFRAHILSEKCSFAAFVKLIIDIAKLDNFKLQMALQKINHAIEAQPDVMPMPVESLDCSKRMALALREMNKNEVRFFDRRLEMINKDETHFPQEDILQLMKLLNIIDSATLKSLNSPGFLFGYTSALQRAIRIGDFDLFAAIFHKIFSASMLPREKFPSATITDAVEAKLSADKKKRILHFLFANGVELPQKTDDLDAFMRVEKFSQEQREVMEQVLAEIIPAQREAVTCHLTRDTGGVVMGYCWPERYRGFFKVKSEKAAGIVGTPPSMSLQVGRN